MRWRPDTTHSRADTTAKVFCCFVLRMSFYSWVNLVSSTGDVSSEKNRVKREQILVSQYR